jgi:hypothetical protein
MIFLRTFRAISTKIEVLPKPLRTSRSGDTGKQRDSSHTTPEIVASP